MLQVGKKAPIFSGEAVIGSSFKEISSADYKGKFIVLFFYPLDFTFVCPTEIIAFSDKAKEFESMNTQLIGCSVDSKFSHLAWKKLDRKEGGLGTINFPLLSDISKNIARDYSVLIEKSGISLRGVFIIDPNGVLRIQMVNDLSIGRNIDEVLRLLSAVQYTEEHGEVCPANWQKGGATIIADVEKSKKYFSEKNT